MIIRALAFLILICAVMWTASAFGQMGSLGCNLRPVVLEQLLEKYGEVAIASAVSNTGRLIEVLTSEHGETWSIIMTGPARHGVILTCVIGAGEGWRALEPEWPQAGEDL